MYHFYQSFPRYQCQFLSTRIFTMDLLLCVSFQWYNIDLSYWRLRNSHYRAIHPQTSRQKNWTNCPSTAQPTLHPLPEHHFVLILDIRRLEHWHRTAGRRSWVRWAADNANMDNFIASAVQLRMNFLTVPAVIMVSEDFF